MNKSTVTIRPDMNAASGVMRLSYDQWEHGYHALQIIPTQDGMEVDLTGMTAIIQGVKADGNAILNNCTVTADYISVDVTEQMTAYPGPYSLDVVLFNADGTNRETVCRVSLDIRKSVVNEKTLTSIPEYTALSNINSAVMATVQAYVDSHGTGANVRYEAQTLTAAEQAQARANIGAAQANSIVVDRPTTWAEVQRIVRAGIAAQVLAVGDQLTCKRGTQTLVWDVIGFDHDVPVDPNHTHSMTLQLHDCIGSYQYDAQEALYYAETALPAGTYHYTDSGTVKQFTTTKAVPVGGQICVSGTNAVVYASQTTTTATETVAITTGSGGTELKTTNSINRVLYGSNNWEKSAIRQWVNSSAAANTWWAPASNYDRPPSNANIAGFLNGIGSDFLAVLGKVTKRTGLNTACDGGGYKDTEEKLFLPSKSECYFAPATGVDEGGPYQYYSLYSDLSSAGDNNDSNRVKKTIASSTAVFWWLRTPLLSQTHMIYNSTINGKLGTGIAINSGGIAPCCCIV